MKKFIHYYPIYYNTMNEQLFTQISEIVSKFKMLTITHRKDSVLFIQSIRMKRIHNFERAIKSLLQSNDLDLIIFRGGGGVDYYIAPKGLFEYGISVDYCTRNMTRLN